MGKAPGFICRKFNWGLSAMRISDRRLAITSVCARRRRRPPHHFCISAPATQTRCSRRIHAHQSITINFRSALAPRDQGNVSAAKLRRDAGPGAGGNVFDELLLPPSGGRKWKKCESEPGARRRSLPLAARRRRHENK